MTIRHIDVTDANGIRVIGTVEVFREPGGRYYTPGTDQHNNPRYADHVFYFLNTRDACIIDPNTLRHAMEIELTSALEGFGILGPDPASVARNVDFSLEFMRNQCIIRNEYVSNETSSGVDWSTGEGARVINAKAYEAIQNPNGGTQLVLGSEGIRNADGSSTLHYFDPSDSQPWEAQTLTRDPAGHVTADQIINDDGTFSLRVNDTDGTHAITTGQIDGSTPHAAVTRQYDAAGHLMSENFHNEDGSSTLFTYDTSNETWTRQVSFFDPAHNLRSETIVYDDGRLSVRQNDVDAAQPWSALYTVYTSGNQIERQDIVYDDGTSFITVNDLAAAETWSSRTEWVDSFTRLTTQTEFNDDGTKSITDYDVGSAEWSSQTSTYDGLGRLTALGVDRDDGSSTVTAYDAANANAWSSPVQIFDAADRMTSDATYNRDGTSSVMYFDFAGANFWSELTIAFDAVGRTESHEYRIDDGTSRFVRWDAASEFSWSFYQNEFAADGSRVFQYGILDDTHRWLNTYNLDNLCWKSEIFDAYGAPSSVYIDGYEYERASEAYNGPIFTNSGLGGITTNGHGGRWFDGEGPIGRVSSISAGVDFAGDGFQTPSNPFDFGGDFEPGYDYGDFPDGFDDWGFDDWGFDGGGFGGGFGFGFPVILDLDGNGIDMALRGASGAAFDLTDAPGREHAANWALRPSA